MGAPSGNNFWELRSKHGRDKLFATPDLMWGAACEYFEWCQENPWNRVDFKGKDVEEVKIPTARPFTLTGLCLYLDCSSSYFRTFKSTLKEKDKDFLTIIMRIEDTIYTQQFEGAAVQAYSSNIIARNLGIKDNMDFTTGGDKLQSPTFVFKELNGD